MVKFRANTMIIPTYPSLKDRDRNIRLLYNGHNAIELSLSFNISIRTIYRIIKKKETIVSGEI